MGKSVPTARRAVRAHRPVRTAAGTSARPVLALPSGNAARWEVIQRHLQRTPHDTSRAPADPADQPVLQAPSGEPVGKLGIVDNDGVTRGIQPGLNLRQEPSTGATVLERLPHNRPVFVDKKAGDGSWYFVVDRRSGEAGYVAADYVNTELPDPEAKLHRIGSGETALHLAHRFYGTSAYKWGADARFYVNVMALVNRDANRGGIRKPAPDADWDTTETVAGSQIWIPSLTYAQTLRGQVKSGSISYGAWEKVKSAAEAALEVLIGTGAFLGGVVAGALKSVWDLVAGVAQLAWSLIKSIVTASIVSDARSIVQALIDLDPAELADAIGSWFNERWNHRNMAKRWYWRGHIVGYALAEVLMLFLTGGAATALKGAGKGAKLIKLIQKLPGVAKAMSKAKALSQGPKAQALKRAMEKAKKPVKTAAAALRARKAANGALKASGPPGVKVPLRAKLRPLKPDPHGGAQYGFELKWTSQGKTYRFRAHGPDGTAPPGSNARAGRTYRVQEGGRYLDANGKLHPRNVHNPASPHHDPAAANATHIPWPGGVPWPR